MSSNRKEKYPTELIEDLKKTSDVDQVKSGFKINFLKMKDGENGKCLWEKNDFNLEEVEKNEELPKELLKCKVIVREINFTSKEKIEDLELIQNFYLLGELIESSRFYFGFVIPKSTNSWEQIVEAKNEDEMLTPELLSGNLTVEIMFLSKGEVIVRNSIIIYYV